MTPHRAPKAVSCGRLAGRLWGPLLVLAGLLLVPVTVAAEANASHSGMQPAPVVTIPDTAYDFPADAVFVSPTGNDSNAGTQGAPVATVKRAVVIVPAGGTVVVRAGTYRQSLGTVRKQVTLQNYPHEQAWFSGSEVVSGWVKTDSVWVHSGWTTQFCQTCYHSGAIDPKYPEAGKPDMVFVDGQPLKQKGSAAGVGPGTFAVDYTTQQLIIGADPTGRTVEASTKVRFAKFVAGAQGSVVRGLGFTQFSPDWDYATPAMVVANTAGMRFENNAFTWSASRGLAIYGQHATVRGNLVLHNGYTGIGGFKAHYLLLEGNVVSFNNAEHFHAGGSPVAAAAGAKIATTRYMVVRDNVFNDNWGNGFWSDVSSYDLTLVRNSAARNRNSGFYVELTTKGLVASNLSYRNGLSGLKISGSTDIRIYNNTLANNAKFQTFVIDDGRDNKNTAELALGITWSTANNSYVNNIFYVGSSSTGPLIKTYDYNRPRSNSASNMISGMDYDVYFRASTASPSVLVDWTQVGAPASFYRDLLSFQLDTGYEGAGLEAGNSGSSPFFVDEANDDYRLQVATPASGSGAPLPDDVAAAVGVMGGVPVDRGALIWANGN